MKEAYLKYSNLKLAADELGMKWQTLYWHLKKNNIPVTGDKSKYGSAADRFAAKSESDFMDLVPSAKNMNRSKYQSKIDFKVNDLLIDLKASKLAARCKKSKSKNWAFSIKKQELMADFIVCFGYVESDIESIFLLPKEIVRFKTTISIPRNASNSKYGDYLVSKDDLREFFEVTTAISDSVAAQDNSRGELWERK